MEVVVCPRCKCEFYIEWFKTCKEDGNRCEKRTLTSTGTPSQYCGPMKEKKDSAVEHPNHYTVGGIETIDYIQAKLTPEGFEGYLVGNIIKYISRYKHKGGVEDLKKARFYLNLLIENLESQDVK